MLMACCIIGVTMLRETAINIQNATVEFGTTQALDSVTTTIKEHAITGLIGPSGAGKTTLIRAIVGRQRLHGGSIEVFGLPAGSAELRNSLSYKTQEISAYYDLTVQQNIAYFAAMMNVARDKAQAHVAEIIEMMDLAPQTHQLVGSLSGGQKQRVSLGIALINNPKLLVLDEPTVGLDPVLRDELWGTFREIAKNGATIVISSHVMDEAERCDDLLLIRHGAIVAHESPENMRKLTHSSTIEESFLKLAREQR